MEFFISLLLCLIAFNTSLTWATNVRAAHFKGIVCNQCEQWCDNTDLVTTGPMRRGKAGPQGPVGRPGDIGPPGRVGPVGPAGPQGEINMTLVEQILDRKIKEGEISIAVIRRVPFMKRILRLLALQVSNGSSGNGEKLESASARNHSGAVQQITSSCDGAKLESALERNDSGGVFQVIIPEVGVRNVFCDVIDDGGNWTIFQRRMNGNVDFFRGWDDYVNGFGDLQGDHWLGLEALHQMTKGGNMEMKIKMIKKDWVYWVAKYSNFRIGPGSDNYRLYVSGYSGNGTYGDSLAYHNNHQFSTKDADHDGYGGNCASTYEGAWWYNNCHYSNLNGNFHKTGDKGITWNPANLRFSEMKFRERA